MSGLETAIRNALDRSDRADGKTRARIYQSARQALDAGLQKQGVSDMLIVLQQRKRLEEKIREIETEEIDRLTATAGPYTGGLYDDEMEERVPDFEPVVEPDRPVEPAVARAEPAGLRSAGDAIELGGATRQAPAGNPQAPAGAPQAAGDLGGMHADRLGRTAQVVEEPQRPVKSSGRRGRRQLDVAPERAAKPRRKRGFISRLVTWVVTLMIVAGGCWWFYSSGMVQSVMQDALEAANRAARGQGGQSNSRFDPRGGFSNEWVEIFKPADVASLKLGRQATAAAADGSDGPAVRLLSATPTDGGDVSLTVPPELLKEMAGKSSTIALTLQAGANQGIQISVRCDFGSLGSCARHRFTASQEKLEALFKVNFDRTLAPNAPGRLIINAGLDGADKPVLLYSVRILPGR